MALTYLVDPLQLFRPSRLVPPAYSEDTRMQNAGLLRSQSFDTAFMGTSMAIHFPQSDIDRVLGVRSLKLAMTGSNSRQQGFVLYKDMIGASHYLVIPDETVAGVDDPRVWQDGQARIMAPL